MQRDTKVSVHDLLASKGRRTWVQVHVDTPAEAAAAEAAGIRVLSCEPDHNLEAIRRSAPRAMISAACRTAPLPLRKRPCATASRC